jgi:hypothetical protein
VNDIFRGKTIAFCEFRPAGGATAEQAALLEKFRAGGAMDCPVNASASKQRVIGGVDDSIHGQGRNVGFKNRDSFRHSFHPRAFCCPAMLIPAPPRCKLIFYQSQIRKRVKAGGPDVEIFCTQGQGCKAMNPS